MESSEARLLVSQLAEDLGWLEEHCRSKPELAPQALELRLAAALVRNVIGPYLNGQPPAPLHIVVVGGAGAGKSTVVNMLSGSAVAEANPQAGYTRHPTAYVPSGGKLDWPAHLGFLGPLQRLAQPSPANLDQDVYQVRKLSPSGNGQAGGSGPLGECVIWDCPDMTTWAATGYVPRLVEVAGLADIIVYVASDERYNDVIPTQFLHMLIRAGKPVVVCLTKMREADVPALLSHFQSEVLARLPAPSSSKPTVAILAIPFLSLEQLADPSKGAGKYRIPLVNQVFVLTQPVKEARLRTVRLALDYLTSSADGLLEAARRDLAALEGWRSLVQTAQVEFDSRYQREFLNSERFRRFDDASDQLLDQLELPGAGKAFRFGMGFLRFPYRALRGAIGKALSRPESVNLTEHEVLEGSIRAWLDQLRAEAIRRADSHPLWKHVAQGFQSGLPEMARDRFDDQVRRFQLGSADELDATIASVTMGLHRNPNALATYRIGKLLLDVLAVGLGVWAGNFGLWSLLWIPVFASIEHQGVELLVRQFVDQKRQQVRAGKRLMVSQYLSAPMAEWFIQWPTSGGSVYERLQIVLRRVPATIKQLSEMVVRMTAVEVPPLPEAV